MKNLISYNQAVSLKNELESFINLVDNYEVNNIKSWIIKEYILTYSIPKVIKSSLKDKPNYMNETLNREMIIATLNENPTDDLHRIAKKMYKKKINKRRYIED